MGISIMMIMKIATVLGCQSLQKVLYILHEGGICFIYRQGSGSMEGEDKGNAFFNSFLM